MINHNKINDDITKEAATRSNPKRNKSIGKKLDDIWLLRDDDSDYE